MGCGDLHLDPNPFQEQIPLHPSSHCIQAVASQTFWDFALYLLFIKQKFIL